MPYTDDGEYYFEGNPLELAQEIQDFINTLTDGPMYDEFMRVLSIGIPLSYVLVEGFATSPSIEGIEHMEITLNEMKSCMALRAEHRDLPAGRVMVLNYIIYHGALCHDAHCSFEDTHNKYKEYQETGRVSF